MVGGKVTDVGLALGDAEPGCPAVDEDEDEDEGVEVAEGAVGEAEAEDGAVDEVEGLGAGVDVPEHAVTQQASASAPPAASRTRCPLRASSRVCWARTDFIADPPVLA